MIRGILFDLDGTLLNTLKDLTESVNFVLLKHHLKPIDLATCKSYIGNGNKMLMKRAIGNNDVDVDLALEEFKQYYKENIDVHSLPYEGIINMLQTLKEENIKIAVVSNKFQQGVSKLCEKYFKEYIEICIGNSENINTKPNLDMIELALEKLNLTKDECLLVGDSDVDALTAKNANMEFVHVSWGYKKIEEIKNIEINYEINNADELINIIKEKNNG